MVLYSYSVTAGKRECSVTFFCSHCHPYLLATVFVPAEFKGRVDVKEGEGTVKGVQKIAYFDYLTGWLYAIKSQQMCEAAFSLVHCFYGLYEVLLHFWISLA